MITKENIPPIYSDNIMQVRLHTDSQHTYFGEAYSSQASFNMLNEQAEVHYKEEYFYINSSYRDITVMSRNGLAVKIPYMSHRTNNGFIIRKIIRIRGDSLGSAIDCVQSICKIDDAELSEIKKAITNASRSTNAYTSIMIDFAITAEDINSRGGTLYHYHTDLVVSFDDTIKIDVHPYSTRFLNIGTFGVVNDYCRQRELNLKLKYVNHAPNAGPAYINIMGKVFTVYPQKDAPARKLHHPKLGEKVYEDYLLFYYTSNCDPDVINDKGVTVMRMSLEEAKLKVGLHDNYIDALNSGDSDAKRKEELLELGHKLELLKQSTVIEKARLEKEELARKEAFLIKDCQLEEAKKAVLIEKQNLETKLSEQKRVQSAIDIDIQRLENEKKLLDIRRKEQDERLDREKKEQDEKLKATREENDVKLRILRDEHDNKIKQEAMYWKDFYENKTYQRKETSDFIKYIPGIIIGISGIVAVWAKYSAKTE